MCLFSLLQWWVRSDPIRRLSLPLGSKNTARLLGIVSSSKINTESSQTGQKTSRMSTLGCRGDVMRLSLQTVHPAETSHMTFSIQTGLCSRQTQEKCLYIPVNCRAWQRSSRKWLQSTKTSQSCGVACKPCKLRGSVVNTARLSSEENPDIMPTLPHIIKINA